MRSIGGAVRHIALPIAAILGDCVVSARCRSIHLRLTLCRVLGKLFLRDRHLHEKGGLIDV